MYSNSWNISTMTCRIKISDEIVVAFIKTKDNQLERREFIIWTVISTFCISLD